MIPFLGPADPFPPVEQALDQPDGLLAAGGSLTTRRLRRCLPARDLSRGSTRAIRSCGGRLIRARCCGRRGCTSRTRSRRSCARKPFFVTIDRAFARVLDGCAAPRAGDSGTWLSPPMRRAYSALHAAGLAHSIEVWMDGELAGGFYGVAHRPDVLRRVDVLAPHRRLEDRDGPPGGATRSLGFPADRLPARD